MSTQTPVVELETTNEELMEFIETPVVEAPAAEPKKKKNIFYRLLALLLALAPIAVLYFLQVKVMTYELATGRFIVEDYKLLDVFLGLFNKESGIALSKLFNFLPLLALNTQIFGVTNGLLLYAIPVSMAICLVIAIVALFSGKAAPGAAKLILFIEFIVYAAYIISIILTFDYSGQKIVDCLDYVWLGLAGGALILYVIISAVKAGKEAFIGLVVFLLTAASAGAFVYGICAKSDLAKTLFAQYALAKWIILGAVGVYALSVFISCLTISAKKLYGADIARAVIMVLLGGAIVACCFVFKGLSDFLLYGVIIAGAAFVLLVFESIVIGVRNAKAKKARKAAEPVEETETETVEETPAATLPLQTAEECLQAIAATEPVVEEVVEEPVVEEVVEETPADVSAVPATPVAETYGSGFDTFIATLTTEERTQFTQIFLLRSENKLPAIPEYVVGGDNKVFFRKIFVNLGSLRARIPDGLMEKIYQFTIRQ